MPEPATWTHVEHAVSIASDEQRLARELLVSDTERSRQLAAVHATLAVHAEVRALRLQLALPLEPVQGLLMDGATS